MADQSKKYKFDISNLNLHYGDFHALKDVNMQIEANKITAFIGRWMWKVYIFKDFEPHE